METLFESLNLNLSSKDHRLKRAYRAYDCLCRSGLWPEFKKVLEELFRLPEKEQLRAIELASSGYDNWVKFRENDFPQWRSWASELGAFGKKNPHWVFRNVAYNSPQQRELIARAIEKIVQGKAQENHTCARWRKNYDYSVTISKDTPQAWYSEEYKNCGNGHYFILLDTDTALFVEDD